MKRLFFFTLFCSQVFAACGAFGPTYSVAGNFTADLSGSPDIRLYTWGVADSMEKDLTFTNVPAGCVVQITHLAGDFVAWPLGVPPAGTQAGVLVGIFRSSSGASPYADFAADGCFLYRQSATAGDPVRLAFSESIIDGNLDADNKLVFKMADWLNNTGLIIHMEVSLVLNFRYVDSSVQSPSFRPSLKVETRKRTN